MIEYPKTRFSRRIPKPGTVTRGLIGNIYDAGLGWYLTPFGYLIVSELFPNFRCRMVSFDAKEVVERYNNRMGAELDSSADGPLSYRLNKHIGLGTKRGFK